VESAEQRDVGIVKAGAGDGDFLRFQEITQMVLEPGTLVPLRSRQYLVEEVSPASNPGEQTQVRLFYIDVMIHRAHRWRQKESVQSERGQRGFSIRSACVQKVLLPFNRPETVCPGPGVTGISRVVARGHAELVGDWEESGELRCRIKRELFLRLSTQSPAC
jgi:hypothetical protein